jgi:uncharacterized protein YeaO (DUF488 family)
MIKTSYFAKCKDGTGVAVSLKKPFWFKGEHAPELAPTPELREMEFSDPVWEKKYRADVLTRLNPAEIADKYRNKTLCCYEKAPSNCHRSIIAAWLKENGFETAEA